MQQEQVQIHQDMNEGFARLITPSTAWRRPWLTPWTGRRHATMAWLRSKIS